MSAKGIIQAALSLNSSAILLTNPFLILNTGVIVHMGYETPISHSECRGLCAGLIKHRTSPARGFTLIEIMVVVAIIAILGATVVPLIMDRPNEARVVRAKNDIASYASALELYRLDNFNYPSTEQGLEALVTKPSGDPEPANWNRNGYVKKINKDPWGRDYLYQSEDGQFEIVSLGSDGVEGGDDFASDISNLEID